MRTTILPGATLYLADAMALLAMLPDAHVDAIITDPPYSSGGAFRGDRAGTVQSKYVQSSSGSQNLPTFSGDNRDQRAWAYWCTLWLAECLRVAKPGAPILMFCDWRQLPTATDVLQAGGWVWRGIVPWVKKAPRPQKGRFAAAAEYVVWGSAGPMPTERDVDCLPGFYEYSYPQAKDRMHVTQKPDQLMADMAMIVPAGATILDPFMGAGTTGVGAIMAGREFIGCDNTQAAFDAAVTRIDAVARQGRVVA